MKRVIGCSLILWWGSCMWIQALPEVDYLNRMYHQEDRVSLVEALKELETHYGQTLVFTYEDVSTFQVRMTEWKPTIEQTLDSLLADLPLTYIRKQNHIVIRKKQHKPDIQSLGVSSIKKKAEGITGQIINKQQQAIEAAFVCLVDSAKSQPVSQAITDAEGRFSFPRSHGNLCLSVTCLGYKPYLSSVFNAEEEHELPVIVLEEESQVLEKVVVIGEKAQPVLEQKPSKLVFNVENSINAQGSNAFDVLKQLPGISVQEESKTISLNGRSSILILLNGKPTYMQQAEIVDLLKSTSSANIKQIEVMSNASAQYDAAGSGGILNIVLKKRREAGFQMMMNVGATYWFNPRQNLETAFNYSTGKWNIYGNYSHNFGHSNLYYGSERKQNGKLFDSQSTDTDKRNTAAATLGADYQLTEHHAIGVQGTGNFVFGPGSIYTHTDVYDDYDRSHLLYSLASESQYEHQKAARYNFNFNYTYELPDERTFTFDADYSWFDGNSRIYQPNTYYSPAGVLDSVRNYRSLGGRDIHLYALSAHYTETAGPGEIRGGMKFSNVSSRNTYQYFQVLPEEDVLDKDISNDFSYLESILAAYLLYDFHFGEKWNANAGLRAEYTHSDAHLMPVTGSTNEESHVRRDYVDLFPSAGVTFKPDEKQCWSLSYGRRIDRPVYSDLNPIEQALDGLSTWKGNPFLKPQKTNRISLQYQYDRTSVEVSYSHTSDYQVQVTDTLGPDKIVMEPRNLGEQSYWGFSVSQALRLLPGWNLTLSGNAYYLDNQMAFDAQRYYQRKRWAGNFSLQTSFPLFWGIRSEVLGVYLTKRLGGSTEVMNPTGFVDIGFQKKFCQGKAAVKLSVSDIFWSNRWGDGINYFGGFESTNYGYGESRMVRLNFTYTFGGSEKRREKHSNIDSELNRF
mgnify:FL=1